MADITRAYNVDWTSGTGDYTGVGGKKIDDELTNTVFPALNSIRRHYYNLASAPSNPNSGDEWRDPSDGTKYWYNGSAWVAEVVDSVKVTTRNVVLQGEVDGSGNPILFAAGTGLACNLQADDIDAIFVFANGNDNDFGELNEVEAITSDQTSFWSSLPTTNTVYLYVNRNTSTGALTGGYTTVAPVYQKYAPTHGAGKHWLDTNKMIMYSSDGASWTAVQRVFVGTATTDGAGVTAVSVYPYNVLRQDVTGNVTGNLTGNVTGNADTATNGTPVGTVIYVAQKTAPSGYLKADGTAVSRTTYSALFAALCPPQTFTVTIASPAVFSATGHGLSAGDPIRLTTTGALPTGLAAGTTYYVISAGLTADAFEVSSTLGGAAVNTSGSQSGTHTLRPFYYGVGDGSTTFNVPDLRGEFVRGYDDGRGVDSARVLGSAQAQDVQPHGHALSGGSGSGIYASSYAAGVNSPTANNNTYNSTGTETRPRNIALLACIKT